MGRFAAKKEAADKAAAGGADPEKPAEKTAGANAYLNLIAK